ncbi:TolC family protein [Sediminibacterium ginsengisoli]|uniref:Efflux transporter, outer membrane factor (OMF) lipoprotein, NodT family n=1 Tax=Sediminibacterium ginsengisoli TaxID=413434 RepID=A0A1T4QAD4_9BACT|nr:TolC family protein [Sediminibacterium ginsengisoli]SKA00655.1 efflux transporter, outer membrane factor (OMF) lipoprotein, NodT family [Sediminibacterium ginsengisoli]
MIKIKPYIAGCIGMLAFASGCKTFQPVTMPGEKPLPAVFAGEVKDSSSIADIPWRNYFNDTILVNLIDTALANNQDMLIAWQRMEAAKARFMRDDAALRPSVDAVVTAGFDKFGKYTMSGVGNFDTNLSPNIDEKQKVTQPLVQEYFAGLRSSWEVDLRGKLKNAKKASAARLLASEKGRQFVVTSLIADIAGNYYSLLALDNQLQIIRRNIRYQQDALGIVKVMLETGRGTALAVQQFQAQLYNTESYEHTTRQQIIDVETRINYLLGRYPQQIRRDSTTLTQLLPDVIHSGIPSAMIARRPDIQQAELELEAGKLDVAVAKAAALPALTLTPYIGLNAFKSSVLFNPASVAYGMIGGLTAPLLNRKAIKSDYQFAGAAQREAFYRYQQTLLNGFNEVYTGLNHIDNQRKVEKLKELEVAELQSGVATANDLYVAGYASYLEVITAQKSVLQAEFELNETRKNVRVGLVQLYRALGGGWK